MGNSNKIGGFDIKNTKEWNITLMDYISPILLKEILQIIHTHHKIAPNFSINLDELYYKEQAHILSKKYNIDFHIIFDQLKSIYRMEMNTLIARSEHLISKNINHICNEFKNKNKNNSLYNNNNNNNNSLQSIIEKYKLPYLATLKQLLNKLKYSPNEIKELIRHPNLPDSEKYEISKLLHLDPTSSINSLGAKHSATAFENKIAHELEKHNIKFKTEEDFRQQQQQQKEKQQQQHQQQQEQNTLIATPDFLFEEPILLNGNIIYWIDAKNYAYYGNKMFEKKLQQQAAKYTHLFGNGVFMFSKGTISVSNNKTLFVGYNG